jgi:hypothetical protein
MKVVGFTIVRNAIKYDYPILESIASILPVCDEVLVSVGKSDDDTLANKRHNLLQNKNNRIRLG